MRRRTTEIACTLLAFAAALIGVGCDPPASPRAGDPTTMSTPSTSAAATSAPSTSASSASAASASTVDAASEAIALVLPADLPRAAEVRVTPIVDLASLGRLPATPGQLPPRILAAGRFEPSGLQCPQGIQVDWKLAKKRRAGDVLYISFRDDPTKPWRDAGGTAIVDGTGTRASGVVYHFTDYALGDAPPPPGSDGTFYLAPEGNKRIYETAHFKIEYQRIAGILAEAKQDTDRPQFIRDMAREYERIRDAYRRVGYRTPESQTVTLAPIAHGRDWAFGSRNDTYRAEVFGEAAKTGFLTVGCADVSGKLMSLDALKQTMAHEYFHRVQMQYYYLVAPDKWLREGTANIMELLVYPELADATVRRNDNMSPVKYDTVSLASQGDEAASFFLYLHHAIGPHVVRRIWEQFDAHRFDTSGWRSLEAAIKSSDASDSVSFRFLDFAEELLVTTPPKNPLYAHFRVGRTNAPATCVEARRFETGKAETIAFAPPKWTFKYYVYDRPGSAKGKLRLDSASAATVKAFAIDGEKVTSLGTLSPGADVECEASAAKKVGLLVVNNRDRSGEAKLSVKWEEETPVARMEVQVYAKTGADRDLEFRVRDGSALTHDERRVKIRVLVIGPENKVWRPKVGEPAYSVRGSGGVRERWYVPWEFESGGPRGAFQVYLPLKRGLSDMKVELLDPAGAVVEACAFKMTAEPAQLAADDTAANAAEAERLFKAAPAEPWRADIYHGSVVSRHAERWEDAKAAAALDAWAARLDGVITYHDSRFRFADHTGDLATMQDAVARMEAIDPKHGFLPSKLCDLARRRMIYENDLAGARALWARAKAMPSSFPIEECPFVP